MTSQIMNAKMSTLSVKGAEKTPERKESNMSMEQASMHQSQAKAQVKKLEVAGTSASKNSSSMSKQIQGNLFSTPKNVSKAPSGIATINLGTTPTNQNYNSHRVALTTNPTLTT